MRILTTLLAVAAFAACGDAETKTDESPKGDTLTNNSTASTPALNTLTDAEKSEGWQLLFDGTSKSGWHVFNNTSDGGSWKVVDGGLFLDSNYRVDGKRAGGGDLVTDEEYDNFELALEWKIDSGGNSGVIFLVNEDKKYGATYHTGLEMQVLDNAAHKDASIIKHRAGDLYDLVTSTPETVKKAGEWNAVRIVVNKGVLEFYLNGPKVMSTILWDDNWKKMVAASKFKAWKDFGTFKKGRIALQDHGDPVWYRNIKIKKLQ